MNDKPEFPDKFPEPQAGNQNNNVTQGPSPDINALGQPAPHENLVSPPYWQPAHNFLPPKPPQHSGNGYPNLSHEQHRAGGYNNSFGQPLPNAAYGTPFPPASSKQKKEKKSHGVGILATAVAVSLIVGSAAGFGGSYLFIQSVSKDVSESAAPNTITINNPDKVNMVTAVATKAAPSVVTLQVSLGQSGGTGSGVILSEDGYVLTNNHVVTMDGASGTPQITVKTNDGTLYNATIVAKDPVMDLAVVKLENAEGLAPIEFADSSQLNIGEETIAIGAPLGLEGTVTQGVISSLHRSINVSAPEAGKNSDDNQEPEEGEEFFRFWRENRPQTNSTQSTLISLPVIQTDASINPGNSGGALLNAEGQLIGINVAIATTNSGSGEAGSIGVGFAIPSNLAKRIATELIENKVADHGLLGATIRTASLDDSSPAVAGATIVEISPDSAADKAGLKIGDVVTKFNGISISTSSDLTAQVRYLPSNSEAEVVYYRNGQQHTATVTLGAMPTE